MANSSNDITITFGVGSDSRVVKQNFKSPEEIYQFFKTRVAATQTAPSVQQSVLLSASVPKPAPIEPIAAKPDDDLSASNIFREDIVFDGTCVYYGYANFVGKCKVSSDRSTVVPAGRGRLDLSTFRVPNPVVKFERIEGDFDAKSIKNATVSFRRGADQYFYNGSLKGLALDEGTLVNETLQIDFTGKFENTSLQNGVISGDNFVIRGKNLNVPYYEVNGRESILAIGGRNSTVSYKHYPTETEIEFTTDEDSNRKSYIFRTPKYIYAGEGTLELDDDDEPTVNWHGFGTLTDNTSGQKLRGRFDHGDFEHGHLVLGDTDLPVRRVWDEDTGKSRLTVDIDIMLSQQ